MRKYITNTQNPTNAQPVPKEVAIHYIDDFRNQSVNITNPIDEAKKGNICSGSKRNIEDFNNTVSRGIPGQVVEIHGNKETGTVMAKFENKDGSLVHEVITSADTPPNVDRDEYYDDFEHMFGERDESLEDTQIQDENDIAQSINPEENISSDPLNNEVENTVYDPTINEGENINTDSVNNSNDDNERTSGDINLTGSSSVLGKRNLDESDQQTNKRPKKNDDDDNEGSGPTISGLSNGDPGNESSSARQDSFRIFLDKTFIFLINIITTFLDIINDISTMI